jgi:methanogenic corrinoid protein MtbC1
MAARPVPQRVRMVEGERVPRLVLMRRPAPAAGGPPAGSPFSAEHREELVRLLVRHDAEVASAYVERLRRNGTTTQEICLHLLPGAARRLGQLWEEDRCGFAQVTMAVCRLHQLLHRLTADERQPPPRGQEGGGTNSILLSCMPGEQHTFGVLVVARFLRRAGWNVRNHFPADNEELLQSVRKKSFSIIGVSIGRYSRTGDLTLLIEALRRASINRRVQVMVGGPVLTLRPQIGRQVGADATAFDAQDAVSWAQGHWQSMAAHT